MTEAVHRGWLADQTSELSDDKVNVLLDKLIAARQR